MGTQLATGLLHRSKYLQFPRPIPRNQSRIAEVELKYQIESLFCYRFYDLNSTESPNFGCLRQKKEKEKVNILRCSLAASSKKSPHLSQHELRERRRVRRGVRGPVGRRRRCGGHRGDLHGDGGQLVVLAVLAVARQLVPRRDPHAEVARQHGRPADKVELADRPLEELPREHVGRVERDGGGRVGVERRVVHLVTLVAHQVYVFSVNGQSRFTSIDLQPFVIYTLERPLRGKNL